MGNAYIPEQKQRQSFPIIHCLVNSKTQEAYKKIFLEAETILRDLLDDRNLTFDAKVVSSDFEIALVQSIQWFWSNNSHLGCYVHFLRAQVTNMKRLGFTKSEFKSDTFKIITLISMLPFLKESSVQKAFQLFKSHEKFKDFDTYFLYFETTWLGKNYPISLWNVNTKLREHPELKDSLKHSTNQVESFHSLLKCLLSKSVKPTIHELIEALKHIEARTMNDLNTYQDKCLIKVKILLLNLLNVRNLSQLGSMLQILDKEQLEYLDK